MSVAQRVLIGLAIAICVAAGSVMVRSPTALEKTTRSGYEPSAVPQLPDETAWVTDSEEDLVARLVHDPVKVRGLSSFTAEGRVALKDVMRRAEDTVRATARSARAAGHLDPDALEAVERAVREYAAELDRLSVLR